MLVKYNNSLIDNLFNGFFDDYITPYSNINENENNYSFELVLPGFSKEDININLENDLLTIEAIKENKNEDNFYLGNIKKIFKLPKNILPEKIDAKQKNGILKITIPKDIKKIKNKKIIIN